MSGGWAGSTRKARLPANWQALREQTKQRAGGRCEWVEAGNRCPMPGTDADHIEAGDDHSQLQWLCSAHHRAKSSSEGGRAWAARRAQGRRPPERHPGML